MPNLSTLFGRKPDKYKYPVFRADDRLRQFTPGRLEKMDAEQLWEELKKLCEHNK